MANRLRVCEFTRASFTVSGLLDMLNPVVTPMGNKVYHEEKVVMTLPGCAEPCVIAVKVFTPTQPRPRPTKGR